MQILKASTAVCFAEDKNSMMALKVYQAQLKNGLVNFRQVNRNQTEAQNKNF